MIFVSPKEPLRVAKEIQAASCLEGGRCGKDGPGTKVRVPSFLTRPASYLLSFTALPFSACSGRTSSG